MAGDNFLDMYMGDLSDDAAEELRNLLNSDDEFRERFRNTDVAGLGIDELLGQETVLSQFADPRLLKSRLRDREMNEWVSNEITKIGQGGRSVNNKDIAFLFEMAKTQVPRLADGGEVEEDYGTIKAYKPSPLEDQRQRITEFLKRNGISNNASAQRQGKNLSMLAEMIPLLGDVQGVSEGVDMIKKGDHLGGGLMSILSMVPFIPASKVVKSVSERLSIIAKKMRQARHNAEREKRNIPFDGDPARRKETMYREEAYNYSKQYNELQKQQEPTAADMLGFPNVRASEGGKSGLRTLSPTVEGELMPRKLSDALSDSDNLPGYGPEELAAIKKEVKDRMAKKSGDKPYLDDYLRNLLDE